MKKQQNDLYGQQRFMDTNHTHTHTDIKKTHLLINEKTKFKNCCTPLQQNSIEQTIFCCWV